MHLFRSARHKQEESREVTNFAQTCIGKGITTPEQVALKWIEAHSHEVAATSFNQARDRHLENFKKILSQLGVVSLEY